ncbi:MAG: ABC transporter ATP-binding protein [Deltaproteobacteria bacterium]|nr:ABC transporter ATP-binding protein [Deltaproteobacteria bacterium]
MLEIKNLSATYGDLQVLWDISLEVREKEIVALLGANGAGKSTLLKCITGLQAVTRGQVTMAGQDLLKLPPHRRVSQGLVLVPEERGIFAELSVEENLRVGGMTVASKEDLQSAFDWVYGLFPILKDRRRQMAGSLSGGEQQMLSIAKGLVSRPRLLLLDELSLGLAPVIVLKLLDLIKKIHQNGVTLILVDQNVQKVLSVSHRGYVFENGRIVLQGPAREIVDDPRTKKAYLGR